MEIRRRFSKTALDLKFKVFSETLSKNGQNDKYSELPLLRLLMKMVKITDILNSCYFRQHMKITKSPNFLCSRYLDGIQKF